MKVFKGPLDREHRGALRVARLDNVDIGSALVLSLRLERSKVSGGTSYVSIGRTDNKSPMRFRTLFIGARDSRIIRGIPRPPVHRQEARLHVTLGVYYDWIRADR